MAESNYFKYSEIELNYLKNKDKTLAKIIDEVGFIKRKINPDLFEAMLFNIIGQQISAKAQTTIWNKLINLVSEIKINNFVNLTIEDLQSCSIPVKKAKYILNFVKKIKSGEFDIDNISQKNDDEIIKELISLDGVGLWTAEMIMIFCLEKKNIISYNDFAITKGLKIIYHHQKIDKKLFEKYKKRYSPYSTIASFYIWHVANNEIKI